MYESLNITAAPGIKRASLRPMVDWANQRGTVRCCCCMTVDPARIPAVTLIPDHRYLRDGVRQRVCSLVRAALQRASDVPMPRQWL